MLDAVLGTAVLFFLVMDPLGNVPIFLAVLDRVRPERRYWIVLRELLLALAIMFVFLVAGESILSFLHLRQESISIAGGIILFLIALKMIFPAARANWSDDPDDDEPFLVPLAVPLIAGPSLLAAILLWVTREPEHMGWWALSLLIAWAAAAVILLAAPALKRVLGKRGLIALERLMGMVLVALAVQMFMDGVSDFLASTVPA